MEMNANYGDVNIPSPLIILPASWWLAVLTDTPLTSSNLSPVRIPFCSDSPAKRWMDQWIDDDGLRICN